ncbi:MAG TPA: hypothetical protein VLJ13_03925 [Brevundimonas sp.]|nr:hypothetical protein [Brevundimonas sp.]
MLRLRLIRLAPIVFSTMIASCAGSLPPSAPPPRLDLPQAASRPCVLDRLPDGATQGDLEVSYVARGAALVACETARELAVETLLAERALQDRWREGPPPRRRSRLW